MTSKYAQESFPAKHLAGKRSDEGCNETVEAENSRIAELELVASAVSGSDIAVFSLDVASDTCSVFGAWRHLMEVGATEEIDFQSEWCSRIHPDDALKVTRAHQDCIDGRTSRIMVEYRLRTRDGGDWLWMRSDAVARERDADGIALNLVGTQRDITDRKRAELALQRSEAQFRSLMKNAPIGTALLTLDFTWIATNTALQTFLGYSEKELMETNAQTLTHHEDFEENLEQVQRLLNGEAESFEMEKRYIRPDGEVAWGHLCAALVRGEDGQPLHYITQVVDITEQRRLDLLKREFISLVGHELRTPVTAIVGALDMLEMICPDGSTENVQKLVKIAKRGGDRLRRMLDDILDFEKVSAATMSLDLVYVDVVDIIEEALTEAQPMLDQHRVSASLIKQETSIVWWCDPTLLRKVLGRLISNAAKFSPEGSGAWVLVTREADALHIRVKDLGRGIPSKLHPHVFEPFWQQDPSDTRAHQGIGLGLSISRHVIRQMGGELSIESVEGPGAEFLISLPTPP